MINSDNNTNDFSPWATADAIESEIKPVIGDNIKKLIDFLGMTRKDFAKKTGISDAALSNYITGKRTPDITYLVYLCRMKEFSDRGAVLTLSSFISRDFDPAQRREIEPAVPVDIKKDFLGNYLCYYFDQSRLNDEGTGNSVRELRYGVVTLYSAYDPVAAENTVRTFASFFKAHERGVAAALKNRLDHIFTEFDDDKIFERNKALTEEWGAVRGSYSGKVVFSGGNAFLSLGSSVFSDNALIIINIPKKRADGDYIGGIGCVASVSHGHEHLPAVQKIIFSRYFLNCPNEEIAGYLSLTHSLVPLTPESEALCSLAKSLYSPDSAFSAGFDECDKEAIITNRLKQLVNKYVSKNICSVGTVTAEEDRAVYEFIKSFAD